MDYIWFVGLTNRRTHSKTGQECKSNKRTLALKDRSGMQV